MSKRTIFLLVAAGVAAVAIVVGTTAAKRRRQGVEVTVDTVRARDLVASVTASGQVRPHTKVDVSADITGRIIRLAVREGDVVRQGQFLLQIDPSQYRAAVERAVAAVAGNRAQEEQARANLVQAQRNYNRIAELKRRSSALVSDEQVEQLRTAVTVNQALLESAQHAVDQARAALRDAQSSLAKTTIVAPMGGQITRLNVEQGETAIMGTLNKEAATLLTISDMSILETRVKVDETDVSRIRTGDSAVVRLDAFPDSTFRGQVTEIAHSSTTTGGLSTTGTGTDQAVDYQVTVRLLDPPSTTRPDFSATATIITDTRHQVLSVPIIALTTREHAPPRDTDSAVTTGREAPRPVGEKDIEGVFVITPDFRVHFRPVRVGIAGEQYFEVLSGVRQGEQIVGGSYQAIRSLKDGALVRPAHGTTHAIPTGGATP